MQSHTLGGGKKVASTSLAALRQVAHLGGAVPVVALEAVLGRDEVAALQAALDKVDVPGLVEDVAMPAGALEDDAAAAELLERGLDLGEGEGLLVVGLDAGVRQGPVGVQLLEEGEGAHEVVDDLEAGGVAVAVAARGEGVDARGVLVVLVSP